MHTTNAKRIAAISVVGVALISQAIAIPLPLPPGGATIVLPGAVLPPLGTALSTITDPFSNSLYSGEVQSWVLDDPAWPAGLTFVYQVRLDANVPGNSLEDINRFSTFSWATFSTDVEQDATTGDAATLADRDAAPGNTLGFFFAGAPAADTFLEGESSALLVVRSDANSFKDGIGGVINGQTSNMKILAPGRVTVPEGGTSILLLTVGLFGLEILRRSRAV